MLWQEQQSFRKYIILHNVFSVITAPFYTIAISMQLSVLPHLLIYGDVKPEQLKKGFI